MALGRNQQELFAEDEIGGFCYQSLLRVRVLRRLCQLCKFPAASKVTDRYERLVTVDNQIEVGIFQQFKHVPSTVGADAFAVAGATAFRPQVKDIYFWSNDRKIFQFVLECGERVAFKH